MSHEEEDGSDRRFEYNWMGDAESFEKNRRGGYHAVMIGDLLHGQCHIAGNWALVEIRPFRWPETLA